MQCEALKNGVQCRTRAISNTKLCVFHTKGLAARNGARGGRRRTVLAARAKSLKKFRAPTSPEEVQRLLAQTVIDLRRGMLDARTAQATATAASGFLRVFETASLDSRLTALERQLEQGNFRKR